MYCVLLLFTFKTQSYYLTWFQKWVLFQSWNSLWLEYRRKWKHWYILKNYWVKVYIKVSYAAGTLGTCGRREMLIFPESSSSFISGLDSVLLSQLSALLSRNGSTKTQREVLYGVMCPGDATPCLECFFVGWKTNSWVVGTLPEGWKRIVENLLVKNVQYRVFSYSLVLIKTS